MLKQFILTMFMVAQSTMVFAAVPDISGTYSGTKNTSEICTDVDGNEFDSSRKDSISNFKISQTGSTFFVLFDDDDGISYTISISGSIDSFSNISGIISTEWSDNYHSDDYGSGEGVIDGKFIVDNNQMVDVNVKQTS
ncbi:MAG: hypothetical protein KZQ83_06680 [gamma proteobacterium symbiont of Taylorina sp.]|nr:hypothetical protein [gamma proteobacterium symbiont of Taylorina sp.]